MATSNERRAPTSGKYVPEQGIVITNGSKIIQIFRPHTSVFALQKRPKNPILQSFFLSLIDPLVATFNERRAPTSRKHVAEQGIVMPN